eukprot:5745682-Pyramimonas_sp.AAC.3
MESLACRTMSSAVHAIRYLCCECESTFENKVALRRHGPSPWDYLGRPFLSGQALAESGQSIRLQDPAELCAD